MARRQEDADDGSILKIEMLPEARVRHGFAVPTSIA
jgi:hypothetical protein